ncbi:unnamed protein product, partial [Ectocarpus sp. 12 AP-2014]
MLETGVPRETVELAMLMEGKYPAVLNTPPRRGGPEAAAEAAKEAVDGLVPARENPLYAGFFDMLSRGKPRGEVAAAMESEGVDAAVLDAPDALFPLPSPRRRGRRRHAAAAADEVAAKEHPEFFKFFKMLAMGMPKGAALQAMAKAGVDQAAENQRGGERGEWASPPVEPPKGMAPAKDHPDYQSYFKMLKMGIPRGAALQKMAKDGVDQSILDRPEALFSLPESGGGAVAAAAAGATAAAAATAAPIMVAVKDHPDYRKYFKMLKMGLPRGAAFQKMATEGVDQAILDTPDAMVPAPPVEAAGEAPSMVAAKDHPDYSKYFKMLKMGLPRGAALQKMATEGKDQAILDTPDAMVPGPPVEAAGEGMPAVADVATAAAPSMVAAKDHPDYSKYFKMLKMGLPRGAALQKMATEGKDQAILDTPDAMVP